MRLLAFSFVLGLLFPLVLPIRAARADEEATWPAASIERAREVEAEVVRTIERATPAFLFIAGGSGVIVSPDGYALTNHHVVAARAVGDRFWVRRARGGRVRATLVGTDPRGDVALLKLEAEAPLPFVALGDSDAVRIGDLAIALGNPYGFATGDGGPSATLGIVSAVHVYRQNYNDAIQTDAAINPGNSGGPLLDLAGEVIGINGRVAVRFGNRMNTGVGYAIPANQISRFLPLLKQGGPVRHGAIGGLSLGETEEGGAGALVENVRSGSAGARAGFAEGDLIVRVGEREVRSPSGFFGAIGTYPAGEEVTVVVRRGGADVEIRTKLVPLAEPARPLLGIRIGPAESNRRGARIRSVTAGSPAAGAGLKRGDILLRFQGYPVNGADDLERLIRGLGPGATVALEIRRGERDLGFEIELGRAP